MSEAEAGATERGVSQIDLRTLRYLDLIVRSGSYLKAAAAIELTQPALSKAIAQLEKQCGLKLLQRGRRGVSAQPTAAGELVLKSTRLMFDELATLKEQLHRLIVCENDHNTFASD